MQLFISDKKTWPELFSPLVYGWQWKGTDALSYSLVYQSVFKVVMSQTSLCLVYVLKIKNYFNYMVINLLPRKLCTSVKPRLFEIKGAEGVSDNNIQRFRFIGVILTLKTHFLA